MCIRDSLLRSHYFFYHLHIRLSRDLLLRTIQEVLSRYSSDITKISTTWRTTDSHDECFGLFVLIQWRRFRLSLQDKSLRKNQAVMWSGQLIPQTGPCFSCQVYSSCHLPFSCCDSYIIQTGMKSHDPLSKEQGATVEPFLSSMTQCISFQRSFAWEDWGGFE